MRSWGREDEDEDEEEEEEEEEGEEEEEEEEGERDLLGRRRARHLLGCEGE